MSAWAALGFFLLTFHNPEGEQWRLLLQSGAVEARLGRQVWREPLPEQLEAAWYWSASVAPTRVGRRDLPKFAPRAATEKRRFRRLGPPPHPKAPPGQLLAGPEQLWREVPENLLPTFSWPASLPELAIPAVSATPWRARFLGQNQGSFWVDLPAGIGGAQLPLAPAEDRHIEVVDGAGAPVADASLFLSAASRPVGRLLARYRAADGRLEIPQLPDSDEANLSISGPGGAPVLVRGFPSTWPARLVLAPGSSPRGRLVDSRGRPQRGRELIVEIAMGAGLTGYTSHRAKTDEQGRFRFANLPIGKALLRTSGGDGVFRDELELVAGELDLGDLVLDPSFALELQIRSTDGAPIAGASITAAGHPLAATSDAEGLAVIEGFAEEQAILLELDAPFYIPRSNLRLLPPHPPRLELRLEPAFYLRGRFLDAGERPLSPGRATARVGNLTASSELAEGGFFNLRLPLGQNIDLLLTSRSGPQLELALPPGRSGEERELGALLPESGYNLIGRVVAEADGAPIRGARIWLPRPGGQHPLLAFESGDLLETLSQDDGSFTLAGLAPGEAILRLEAPGFARRERELALPPRGDDEAGGELDLGTIELQAGARLKVHAAGAASGVLARLDLRGEWQSQDLLETTVQNELAIFPHVPPGPALLTLFEGKRLLCEKQVEAPPTGEFTTECRATPPRVAGVVFLGGRPAPGGELAFSAPPTDSPQIIRRSTTAGGLDTTRIAGAGRPQVEVTVRADGSFATEDLLAGAWRVRYSLEGGGSGPAREVEIPAAEAATLRLDFPFRRIGGWVVDRDERPVAEAWVRLRPQGLLARSAADGSFSIFGTEPGRVAVQAEKFGETSPALELEVPAEGESDPLTLVLGAADDAGKLRVEVERAGEPAGGALVFLEGEGGLQQIATADTQGHAFFDVPAPRPPRLRCGAFFEGNLSLGGWMAWQEAREEGARLVMSPGGDLALSGQERTMPKILAPDDWDVSWWLGRLGQRPIVEKDIITTVHGLPPGLYRISSRRGEIRATVEAGELAEAALP